MRSQSPLPAAWEALTVPLKPVSNAQEHNLRLPAYPLWASCRVHHKFGLVAGFRIDLVHFRMPQGNHSRAASRCYQTVGQAGQWSRSTALPALFYAVGNLLFLFAARQAACLLRTLSLFLAYHWRW
jgi:hypothetical protein